MENIASLYQQRRYVECENVCRSLLLARPKEAQVRQTLIMALQAQGKHEAAIAECENLLELLSKDQDRVAVLEHQGSMSATIKDYESAARSYSQALKLDDKRINTWIALGSCQYELNQYDHCTKSILRAFNSPALDEARYCESLYYLTQSNSEYTYDDMVQLSPRVKQPVNSPHYCFSVGNLYERQLDFPKALDFFDRGNALLRERKPYNHRQQLETVNRYLRVFSQDALNNASLPANNERPTPIFIIGMPRTGSTLIEQILGRHTKISPQGEADWLPTAFVKNLGAVNTEEEFVEICLSSEFINKVRDDYLNHVVTLETPYFTDKLPGNFVYMWLIKLAFPNALVLKTSRDRMATLWSCYKTPLWNGHSYTHSLKETSNIFDLVESATEQWRELFDKNYKEVTYENLVAEPASVVAKILSGFGLEPEEACISYQPPSRIVKTASKNQVSKPIYVTANKSSKNFEPLIRDRIPD